MVGSCGEVGNQDDGANNNRRRDQCASFEQRLRAIRNTTNVISWLVAPRRYMTRKETFGIVTASSIAATMQYGEDAFDY